MYSVLITAEKTYRLTYQIIQNGFSRQLQTIIQE